MTAMNDERDARITALEQENANLRAEMMRERERAQGRKARIEEQAKQIHDLQMRLRQYEPGAE